MSVLRLADSAAHFLYEPTMLGRRAARAHWHHRLHLIPGWLLKVVCDRWDAAIWAEFDEVPDAR